MQPRVSNLCRGLWQGISRGSKFHANRLHSLDSDVKKAKMEAQKLVQEHKCREHWEKQKSVAERA